MKKKIGVLLTSLIMLPCSLFMTACEEPDNHTHTFATTYTYDNTHHWHASTCNHNSEKSEYELHEFGSWHTVTGATHVEDEVEKRYCNCGYFETRVGDKAQGHNYTFAKYIVEDGKAYSLSNCTCNSVEKKELTNYLIVTPENAQSVLDGSEGLISGKTIVFSDGNYGALQIRSTRETVDKIYEYDYSAGTNNNVMTTEVDIEDLSSEGVYHYTRNVEDVTFISTENAEFKGVFSIQSKAHRRYGYLLDPSTGISDSYIDVDPIRNVSVNDRQSNGTMQEGDTAYVDHITLENITFQGLKFTGNKGRLLIYDRVGASVKGITIDSCSFTTDAVWSYIENSAERGNARSAIFMAVKTGDKLENSVVKNCFIDGHFQGVYIADAKNAVISNSVIKNTTHNAIALQASDTYTDISYTTGDIFIVGNVIENTGDRAIRFNTCREANISIVSNIFVDACDSDNELIKSQASTDTMLAFRGNTFNGVALADTLQNAEDMASDKLLIVVPTNE